VLSCWYEPLIIWWLLGWQRKMWTVWQPFWCKGPCATEHVQLYFSLSSLLLVFWYQICLHLKLFRLLKIIDITSNLLQGDFTIQCSETKGFRMVWWSSREFCHWQLLKKKGFYIRENLFFSSLMLFSHYFLFCKSSIIIFEFVSLKTGAQDTLNGEFKLMTDHIGTFRKK
jgi:hypothetical protein